MHNIRVAIATDDGITCIMRHFGDARYYYLYDINESGYQFITKLENTVDIKENESVHGDPQKASGIGKLLKQHQVNTAVAKVFGPNIKRLVKQYACVLVKSETLTGILDILVQEHNQIAAEIEKGEQRKPLDLRKLI